ncbi:MAG: hypothetical protein EA420_02720 [Candidatus Competibacteraceae bacterium]|jgi:hypothetical protein|nr:MAG: hypothetical protein EA420_02720 [Candidatus Competibacteraceae bacterium]
MTEDLGTKRNARERRKSAKPERYYISSCHGRRLGIIGDVVLEAIHDDHPFERLYFLEFEEVTQEEYENTVLDWRYEGNGWEQ